MELIEDQGNKCPKCNAIYPLTQDKCFKCDSQTEKITYYKRIRVERFVFAGLFSFIISIVTLIISKEFITSLGAFAISFICTLSAFHAGNFLLKIGGGFAEKFLPENKPSTEELSFSWKKVLSDFKILFVIVISILVIMLAFTLLKKLLS